MNVYTLTKRLRLRAMWLISLLVAATVILSACDLVGDDTEDDDQQQQAQQEAVQAQETTAAAPAARPASQPPAEDPGPEPPPEATGGGEGATAYSIVFPSLALVMTEDAVATGLVITDGYVVVDERSLRGATTADVLLSNGDTLSAVPSVGRDLFTGLVYFGPLDSNLVRRLPGARLGDGEGIRPGSSVFTIGYNMMDTPGSLPAVFSGVLSGVSEWDAGDRTFLRTDARPDGVTAGMVLVDSAGTVIGIAPAALVGLGWYVSTGDLARSMPPDEITASRAPNPDSASTEHVVSVGAMDLSNELLIDDSLTGQTVSLSISTDTPAMLQLIDINGDVLQDSNVIAGSTILSLALDTAGPYTLSIVPQRDGSDDADDGDMSESMAADAMYSISSSAPLMSMAEADAMTPLEINTPFVGMIDMPGDADSFNLPVQAGATYEVLVRSLLFDTVLLVEGGGVDAVDDDTGGGPFGRDSALTLEPEEDGIVSLTVKDYADEGTGAYILTITQVGGEPPADAMEMTDSAMAMAAMLPGPHGDLSVRGSITDDSAQPTLLGIGSELGEDGSLIIHDDDGVFEIVASIIGSDQGTARVFVFNADDQVIVSGRVILNCGSPDPCLASAVFISPEDSPALPGTWRVLLRPEGAGSGITDWQIEVYLHDGMDDDMTDGMDDDHAEQE